ncbi:MAG: hypothetical protein ACI8RD_005994 [Bacillariaceae sp.]|jgi:hypothetical protein
MSSLLSTSIVADALEVTSTESRPSNSAPAAAVFEVDLEIYNGLRNNELENYHLNQIVDRMTEIR